MTADEALIEYYTLLIEAEQASSRVDFFDLRSEDRGFNVEFAGLVEEDRVAQLKLVKFLGRSEVRDALLSAFGD